MRIAYCVLESQQWVQVRIAYCCALSILRIAYCVSVFRIEVCWMPLSILRIAYCVSVLRIEVCWMPSGILRIAYCVSVFRIDAVGCIAYCVLRIRIPY